MPRGFLETQYQLCSVEDRLRDVSRFPTPEQRASCLMMHLMEMLTFPHRKWKLPFM